MRLYVAVTDKDWFDLHASKPNVDEVNFWTPSSKTGFAALAPSELLLFKLHSPLSFIVGGGFFVRFLRLPVNLVWRTFGEANGVRSLDEMRARVSRYRRTPITGKDNPEIGCIMLAEPFFWPQEAWIPAPTDFHLNVVRGKGYSADSDTGRDLWLQVEDRLKQLAATAIDDQSATAAAIHSGGYGKPQQALPRLGQGLFRTLIADSYERRCAISGERTLPVLEAAHIKPFRIVQRHELPNGLLLRSDLHTLFDEGYITVDPKERRVAVSPRIKEEFSNGRDYYALHGRQLREPVNTLARPSAEYLDYHSTEVFR